MKNTIKIGLSILALLLSIVSVFSAGEFIYINQTNNNPYFTQNYLNAGVGMCLADGSVPFTGDINYTGNNATEIDSIVFEDGEVFTTDAAGHPIFEGVELALNNGTLNLTKLKIDQDSNVRGLYVKGNSDTQYPVRIEGSGDIDLINIVHNSENRTAIGLNGYNTKLSTVKITNEAAQQSGSVMNLQGNNASRISDVLGIGNSGTGQGIKLTQSGNGVAVQVDSYATGKQGLLLTCYNTTSNECIKIKLEGNHTSGRSIQIWNSETDSTADMIELIQQGSGNMIKAESFYLSDDGMISYGDSTPDYPVDIIYNSADYMAHFFNDGNSYSRKGLLLQGGQDTLGLFDFLEVADGNGDVHLKFSLREDYLYINDSIRSANNVLVDNAIEITATSLGTCDSSTEGQIKYNSVDKEFYGCNTTDWMVLS